ncbi:hypothetical protein T440DRAFT_101390 [Plenodomus tracheiphilus IPT5]|uniref:C2H2-type domain-containing protein n=1 Tax=Plenodomus tracheiphilus IPT5 TaxID=1408161 RepID=A0A6A7BL64_9PLEO|nr:hypothetical protein T440DRAFT_101390 [Plenodomus tracheiphilus IPT5]
MDHDYMGSSWPRQPEECTPDPNTSSQENLDGDAFDNARMAEMNPSYQESYSTMTNIVMQSLHTRTPVAHNYSIDTADQHNLETQDRIPAPDFHPSQTRSPSSFSSSSYAQQPTAMARTALLGVSGGQEQTLTDPYYLLQHQISQDHGVQFHRPPEYSNFDRSRLRQSLGHIDIEHGRGNYGAPAPSSYNNEFIGLSTPDEASPLASSVVFGPGPPYGQQSYGGNSQGPGGSFYNPEEPLLAWRSSRSPYFPTDFQQTYADATCGPWSTENTYTNHAKELETRMSDVFLQPGNQDSIVGCTTSSLTDFVSPYKQFLHDDDVGDTAGASMPRPGSFAYQSDDPSVSERGQLPGNNMRPTFNCNIRACTPANLNRGRDAMPSGLSRTENSQLLNPFSTHISSYAPLRSSRSSIGSSSSSQSLRCDACGTEFRGKYGQGNLGRHRRSKHRGYIWPCEDLGCDKVFHRTDARLKHYRLHHLHLAPSPV